MRYVSVGRLIRHAGHYAFISPTTHDLYTVGYDGSARCIIISLKAGRR